MTKILIIEDIALNRQYLANIIKSSFDSIKLLVASNTEIGIEKIEIYNPEVIILSCDLQETDCTKCVKKIKNVTSAPIIILDSQTDELKTTKGALRMEVFDFISKPNVQINDTSYKNILITKIEAALKYYEADKCTETININAHKSQKKVGKSPINNSNTLNKISAVGIGISTGGPPVITKILKSLPKTFKIPILIVQHMPLEFTHDFANRLNEVSELLVKEAQNDDILEPGCVYVAPGGMQMEVERQSDNIKIKIFDGEKVNGHKPSVDVLFSSMAKCFGKECLGIIMTGMGRDGINGLNELFKAGSITWGQNRETCVVYGMPKVAFENGVIKEQLSIDEIIDRLKTYNF